MHLLFGDSYTTANLANEINVESTNASVTEHHCQVEEAAERGCAGSCVRTSNNSQRQYFNTLQNECRDYYTLHNLAQQRLEEVAEGEMDEPAVSSHAEEGDDDEGVDGVAVGAIARTMEQCPRWHGENRITSRAQD
eukprot:g26242.t1